MKRRDFRVGWMVCCVVQAKVVRLLLCSIKIRSRGLLMAMTTFLAIELGVQNYLHRIANYSFRKVKTACRK